MRICFYLTGFTGGGTGRVVSIVGNELQKQAKHSCCALCHSMEGGHTIYPVSFPVTYLYREKTSLTRAIIRDGYVSRVARYVRENQIDVLICCLEMFYPVALWVGRLCGIKVVTWLHTNPDIGDDYRFEKESRWLGARFSDCNVVLTEETLQLYEQRFPGQRNTRIYNPLDPKLLRCTEAYSETSRSIISVGRLNYAKDYERLLRIAHRIMPRYPDWRWDIYGEGEERPKLERLIEEMQLGGFVRLCGQRKDIYSNYPIYAMMVMTSRYEGFPMTLLEAAAQGLPLVAFDVRTGPKEIIRDGVNGFLCSKDSDEEMVNKIEALIGSVDLRKACSQGSKAAAEQFRIDRILPEWERLLDAL